MTLINPIQQTASPSTTGWINDKVLDANTPASCVYAVGCSQLSIREQDLRQNVYGLVLIRENTTEGGVRHNSYFQRPCLIKSCTLANNTSNAQAGVKPTY